MIDHIMDVLRNSAHQPLKASLLNLEGGDMIILLVVVLLLFGPKNLPKLAQSIGKSVRELKNGLQGTPDEEKATPATPEHPAKTEASTDSHANPVTPETKKEDDSHTTTV